MWSVGGRSVMGASHVRSGIPNQDAIAWMPRSGHGAAVVLAVADGHGASIHYRSGIGAHIAVEVATRVLADAIADPEWIASAEVVRLRAVISRIVAGWRDQVLADVAARPLSPSSPDDADPFLPYGATLIAAAIAPQATLVLQLGDGDLLLGMADGTIVRPLAPDRGLIGEQTYSLCQPDAEARMRARVLAVADGDCDFVMLATDGLSKSFADEPAFHQLAGFWRKTVAEEGIAAVTDLLDTWLSDTSRKGSRDDITLGFMTRTAVANLSETDASQRAAALPNRTESGGGRRRRRFARASWWAVVAGMALLALLAASQGWLSR